MPLQIPIDSDSFTGYSSAKKLVVLLHGYTLDADSLDHVKAVIAETHRVGDLDYFIPNLPLSKWSLADPVSICNQLLQQIDGLWSARIRNYGKAYENIIIVGHSYGALLGRKLYVYACGENAAAPFEPVIEQKSSRKWAVKVERIILLAGMNRGWSISHHMDLRRAFAYTLGLGFGGLWQMLGGKKPIILHIQRGAPFLTNLRIQWLTMRQIAPHKGIGNALTVQLLGSVDDLVSPEDNIDLVSGSDFVYLDVAKTGHANIIQMDSSKDENSYDRIKQFKAALTLEKEALTQDWQLPQDSELPIKNRKITDLIFVIHGIRDPGYWTQKLARRVKRRCKNINKVIVSETSSYGYFPILSFLFPWRRRDKVEWLMDQYAEGLAQYPNARFSYIGHSHGSYLLTKALNEYPCCRFEQVVLAGSVVRTDYAWEKFINEGRVKNVVNYVATSDWVVAWFPNAMQKLNWQDLGGAGHRGFETDLVKQIQYIKGFHSAALNEDNWDAIADFIIEGKLSEPPPSIKEKDQSCFVKLVGHISPLLWLGIIYLLWVLGS